MVHSVWVEVGEHLVHCRLYEHNDGAGGIGDALCDLRFQDHCLLRVGGGLRGVLGADGR